MKTDTPTTDQPQRSLAELAREYRTKKDAADAARESVKPASKAALEARRALNPDDTCTWTPDPTDEPYVWGASCSMWATSCGNVITESDHDPNCPCPHCGRTVNETANATNSSSVTHEAHQ